jgi:hypothetical protein
MTEQDSLHAFFFSSRLPFPSLFSSSPPLSLSAATARPPLRAFPSRACENVVAGFVLLPISPRALPALIVFTYSVFRSRRCSHPKSHRV